MPDRDIIDIKNRLCEINVSLAQLLRQNQNKEWYNTAEVSELLKRAEWTVREWCRLGRINADKRACGRGNSREWIISHTEVERIRNQGLLPDPRIIRRRRTPL